MWIDFKFVGADLEKKIGEVQYGIGWGPFGGLSLPQMADMEGIEGVF